MRLSWLIVVLGQVPPGRPGTPWKLRWPEAVISVRLPRRQEPRSALHPPDCCFYCVLRTLQAVLCSLIQAVAQDPVIHELVQEDAASGLHLADSPISWLCHESVLSPIRTAYTLSTETFLVCDAGSAVRATRIHGGAFLCSIKLYTNYHTKVTYQLSFSQRISTNSINLFSGTGVYWLADHKSVHKVVTLASTSYLCPKLLLVLSTLVAQVRGQQTHLGLHPLPAVCMAAGRLQADGD